MAEASAVIGILSFGIQICQGITKYYGAWRDCPEAVSSTSNNIDSLRTIFEQFKHILADKQLERDTRALVEERVSACLAGLRKLEGENKQFGSDKPSNFQMAIHRLSYPFKQDTLDRLKKVVDGLLGQLDIALQVLDIRAGSRHHAESSEAISNAQRAIEKVYAEVHVVRDMVDSVRAQQQISLDHANANHVDTIAHLERLRLDGQETSKDVRLLLSEAEAAKLERILTWLRAPDVTSNHNAACLRRHPGTGQWFLDSAEYLSWKYGGTARLWVHGKIGCCKTVLASTIIEDMRSHCRAHVGCCLAYFYFTFSDDKKQSWEALLRALVMQLSQGRPAVHSLTDAFNQEYGMGLTVRDLEVVLVEILTLMRSEGRSVYVVVDGLDESPDTLDRRVAVFEGLSRIRQSCSDLHLLITSRRYADIERFMLVWESSSVEITAALVNEDIKAFVRYQLASSLAFRRLEDASKTLITSKLGENPDGMFRWAALHLETLRKLPSKTPTRIGKALSILPPTLSATYEQMLSDIPDEVATEVDRCLLWLAVSPQPLALHELAEAMRVDPNEPDLILLESDALDPGDIVEVMSGMVVVYNVYETCARCQSVIVGNYFICQVCSSGFYALCEPCRANGETCHNASHALVSHNTLRVQLAHASVEEFLLGCEAKAERARRFLIDKPKRTSILSRAINRQDIWGLTELHWAVFSQEHDEAQLLLAQGANVNLARFGNKRTPLHEAARGGDARMVATLLGCGADVYAMSIDGSTAMTHAIGRAWDWVLMGTREQPDFALRQTAESEECVKLLLQHGTDPNSDFALVRAVRKGLVSMVRLLLDGGADVDLGDPDFGTTAICEAATDAHDEITTMLLEWAADRDITISDAPIALGLASAFGHHLVVDTLLSHGVDSTYRHSDGRTALHKLADSSHGSRAEQYHVHGGVSQLPPQERYGLILDLLLAQDGADINQADEHGLTPLALACKHGHLGFIERLLGHGPDLEARDDEGRTALFHAVDHSHKSVVELLITRGARVNTVAWIPEGETGWMQSSLLRAALDWQEKGISDLLEANGARLMQNMDEVESRCGVPRPPRSAPKRRRSWPQYRDPPPLGILDDLLPLEVPGDKDKEKSRCDVPCRPGAPKRQRSWPHYRDHPPVEIIDDTGEVEGQCEIPYFPPRAPRRRRSWPRFWDSGPLETRPSASVAPDRPRGDDEEIQWDIYDMPTDSIGFWWNGERTFALRRSLSLVEEFI
ncbi:hypothetical protein LTS10_012014 [Elasticomyces elasticus]|nr:hypothetical protein LTS10_012014 [Elasticomyces elasticus]